MKTINWNRPKLAALKLGYERALKADKRQNESFKVELPEEREPVEFVVSYARHLIEHLDRVFAANPDQPRRENREGEEGQ